MKKKVFYLGPQASYCDYAKNKFVSTFFLEEYEQVAKHSILSTIKELTKETNQDSYAVIPIENSVEGIVRETIDNLGLLTQTNIKIIAETSIPIQHCLASYANNLEEIKVISSHPQAIAQCYNFITNNFREDIELRNELSTAAAIKNLNPENPSISAIGSSFAATLYNKPILKTEINDITSNRTRFILLGQKQTKITGHDKTGFSFVTPNTPGALCKILNILEKHNINMTYIDSRPSKKTLGEYVFFVDIDGHALSQNISVALFEILQFVKDFQYFGSYTII